MANIMQTLMAAGLLPMEMLSRRESEQLKKKCLVCDKLHTHNNSFCSVECCKEFKTTGNL